MPSWNNLNLDNLAAWFDGLELRISNKQATIGKDVLKKSENVYSFIKRWPLLLNPESFFKNISGGESQRIRLATQNGIAAAGHITYIWRT